MTHRVHPFIFRLGETTTWRSRWFNRKNFSEYLREDTLLREWLMKKLRPAHVAAVEIERSPNTLTIIIKTSRPGLLIGRGGEGIEKLKKEIGTRIIRMWKWYQRSKMKGAKREIKLTVEEIKSPETNAAVIAQLIIDDIEKRTPFRRILKRTVDKVMAHKEVKGVKISLSGRLDGAEMARYEWLHKGRVPLQTLRADIDYAQRDAFTTYGVIGVKVWIYKGDMFSTTAREASGKHS